MMLSSSNIQQLWLFRVLRAKVILQVLDPQPPVIQELEIISSRAQNMWNADRGMEERNRNISIRI
ncbi:hypothetical protein QQP08_025562 [Theobroma cacao]|nr:hypothetical protein QQP08_025562 [Theobroma cacao]